MNVVLAAPCLRRYDLLQKLCESAERGTRKPDRYFIVDNGGQLAAKRASGEIRLPETAVSTYAGKPLGVAGAWNLALRENRDSHVIISNDDVELHAPTIESLVRGAEETDAEFIFPKFNPGAMFCVFLIKHSLVDRIGEFDERFYPAYFEDNDFHRRMRLAGVKELQVDSASYDHVVSATLKSFNGQEMAEHHVNFERCRAHYIKKWGNVPGQEAYDKPAC